MISSTRATLGAGLSTAVLLGAVACSSSTTSAGTAPTSGGTTGGASTEAAAAASHASPANAVAAWVADVIENHYPAACALMAENGKTASAAECAQGAPEFDSLRQAWTKNVVTLPPKVTVAHVKSTSGGASVVDSDVLVDGHTLRDLELIGASGQTGSFSLTLDLQPLNGGWYLSNVDIKA